MRACSTSHVASTTSPMSNGFVEEFAFRYIGDDFVTLRRIDHYFDKIALVFDCLHPAGDRGDVGRQRCARPNELDIVPYDATPI